MQITSSPVGEKGKCYLLSTHPIGVMMNKWEGSNEYIGQGEWDGINTGRGSVRNS